jgi:hypothetical protein
MDVARLTRRPYRSNSSDVLAPNRWKDEGSGSDVSRLTFRCFAEKGECANPGVVSTILVVFLGDEEKRFTDAGKGDSEEEGVTIAWLGSGEADKDTVVPRLLQRAFIVSGSFEGKG